MGQGHDDEEGHTVEQQRDNEEAYSAKSNIVMEQSHTSQKINWKAR